MITKVTIKGMKQAVQMFGPAQFAVAKAVADSVGCGRDSEGFKRKNSSSFAEFSSILPLRMTS